MPHFNSTVESDGLVRSAETLGDAFKNQYWAGVERALREIFGADEGLAAGLHEKVDRAPLNAQVVFYDASPFAIAADLAQARYLRQ
ncbi:MAG: hypothetical protein JWL84_2004 [Rhodospirillales bacterium]|jgi:hypothetical protein|nr:hypothetical protein [Rhodospirillales bacterium]